MNDDTMQTNPALVACRAPQLDAATAALTLIQSTLEALTEPERARVVRYILDAEETRKRGYSAAPKDSGKGARPFAFSPHTAKVEDLI